MKNALLGLVVLLIFSGSVRGAAAQGAGGGGVTASQAALPRVFWASDPVLPNDTVLAMGGDLDKVSMVQIARLQDLPLSGTKARTVTAASGREAVREVKPLQPTAGSLKFVLPADLKPGVYSCRLRTGTMLSEPFLLNRPDPWWIQTDQGEFASPGSAVRVFGKALSFAGTGEGRLKASDGTLTRLKFTHSDGCALSLTLPATLRPGRYTLAVHNEFGGDGGWAEAGALEIKTLQPWPTRVFNVMDFYGAEAEKEIQKTLDKGSPTIDRTAAVRAALQKAQANGGGIVYFPEGKYAITGEIQAPPHTILRGAGMGLSLLWWGKGGFALDGGSDARHLDNQDGDVPPRLISGAGFAIEDMSLYLPRLYQTAIETGADFRLQRVRIRVDRYWIRDGKREDGLTLRLDDNGQVLDCDILARGVAIAFAHGRNERIARNRIMAGKAHFALERGEHVIVEDNDLISLDPTAYINLSGEGREIYYARNRQTSFFAHQSDFSWTFDGVGMAYLGKLAAIKGSALTLAQDPVYPAWASETSGFWKRAVVCIMDGRGAGQYRFVTSNQGRAWQIDRPFDVLPDEKSVVSIIPYRGRVLVVGNRFEDAGWVNMGYGSSFDVVCSHNSLYRVGSFLNLGLRNTDGVHASWRIQYLDNDIYEGHTLVQTTADMRAADLYNGPTTRAAIHRRHHLHADNSGSIDIGGNATDVIVEHCDLLNPRSRITIGKETAGILLRANTSPRYAGDGLTHTDLIRK